MSAQPTDKLTLFHGRQTYRLTLPSTLGELQDVIHSVTKVPVSGQTLILSGKKLVASADTVLSDLGVMCGKKLMLLGFAEINKNNGVGSEVVVSVEKVPACLKQIQECRRVVEDVEGKLAGIEKAFEEGKRVKHGLDQVLELSEICMSTLIRLDSVMDETGEAGSEWKGERKVLVNHIQKVLEKCDEVKKKVG